MNLLCINYILSGDIHSVQQWLLIVGIMAFIPSVISILDLRTGIAASRRLGQFKTTSFGLRKTINKDKDYLTYYFMLALIDACLSFFIDYPILCVICCIVESGIEFFSVRENMQKGTDISNHDPVEKMEQLFKVLGEDKVNEMLKILKEDKQ